MSTILTIECPACDTAFPVDPDKVPAGGARTECTVCHTPFRVDAPTGEVAYEAVPEPWEDAGGDLDDGSVEAVTTVEDVVVDEVVTVWDAENAPADDAVEMVDEDESGAAEAWEEGEADGEWEAGDEESEHPAPAALDDEDGGYGGDDTSDDFATADTAGRGEDEVSGDLGVWGASIEDVEPETTEDFGAPEDDESDTLGEMEASVDEALSEMSEAMEEMEAPVDEAFSEMSEAMDGLVQPDEADAVEDETSRLADGIVTDQWSELVSDDTDDAGETADADAWGGGEDDDGWVLETDDEGMTLSDLDLDVERLDTVEDHVRAAQDEPGLTDSADADFITGPGEDLLGGNEVVLPEDALEVEGGIAEVGGDAEDAATPSAEEEEPAGSDVAEGGVQEGEEVFQFGRRDPHDKARRLARVLVSDMITYNPERHEEALAQNRLKDDFEEEIDKSWAEYVEQVGPEIAESTDYWRDALNDILARGEPLF